MSSQERSPRARWIAFGLVGAAVAGVVAWALWPDPEPRQREYLDATACLLTDEKGVAGDQARPVWAAMQQASTSSRVRVQYLAVNGPQTVTNAGGYAASLAGSRCGVVIAVGATQVKAVAATAKSFPDVRFAAVGGAGAAGDVPALDGSSPEALRTAVTQQVTALAE
jgi:hypothetical protein